MSAKRVSNEWTDDEDFPFLGEFVNERRKEIFWVGKTGVEPFHELNLNTI